MDHWRYDIHNPHDSLVAAIFWSIANAVALLGALFRDSTGERLVEGSIERLSERLVDRDLRSRWTDGTFRALVEGDPLRPVFLVVEHKSRLDGSLALQLQRYLTTVLETCGEDFRPGLPVPRVVFMVLHQGDRPRGWLDGEPARGGRLVADLPWLREEYIFRRLDGFGIEGLENSPEADAGTRLLGYSGRERVPVEELDEILAGLARGSLYIGQCLAYISCAIEIAEGERGLRELVRRYGDNYGKRMMTTLTEKWKAEGLAEGLVKGQAEGLAKGQAEGLAKGQAEGLAKGQVRSLLLLMDRRFGPVAEPVRKRVAGASAAELDAWLVRTLDAGSVDEVLAASP